ncbi:hypothetical protein ZWY2020_001051 [Hordeum vulgare]|nr:hypothetical protein ZWY2020_001051 [Hordeum vulgare]
MGWPSPAQVAIFLVAQREHELRWALPFPWQAVLTSATLDSGVRRTPAPNRRSTDLAWTLRLRPLLFRLTATRISAALLNSTGLECPLPKRSRISHRCRWNLLLCAFAFQR